MDSLQTPAGESHLELLEVCWRMKVTPGPNMTSFRKRRLSARREVAAYVAAANARYNARYPKGALQRGPISTPSRTINGRPLQ